MSLTNINSLPLWSVGLVAFPVRQARAVKLAMEPSGASTFESKRGEGDEGTPATPSSAESKAEKQRVRKRYDYKVGDRVITGGKKGWVRYVGTPAFAAGQWVGIELNSKISCLALDRSLLAYALCFSRELRHSSKRSSSSREMSILGFTDMKTSSGVGDGTVKGERYFQCAPGHGVFAKPNMVRPLVRKRRARPPQPAFGSTDDPDAASPVPLTASPPTAAGHASSHASRGPTTANSPATPSLLQVASKPPASLLPASTKSPAALNQAPTKSPASLLPPAPKTSALLGQAATKSAAAVAKPVVDFAGSPAAASPAQLGPPSPALRAAAKPKASVRAKAPAGPPKTPIAAAGGVKSSAKKPIRRVTITRSKGKKQISPAPSAPGQAGSAGSAVGKSPAPRAAPGQSVLPASAAARSPALPTARGPALPKTPVPRVKAVVARPKATQRAPPAAKPKRIVPKAKKVAAQNGAAGKSSKSAGLASAMGKPARPALAPSPEGAAARESAEAANEPARPQLAPDPQEPGQSLLAASPAGSSEQESPQREEDAEEDQHLSRAEEVQEDLSNHTNQEEAEEQEDQEEEEREAQEAQEEWELVEAREELEEGERRTAEEELEEAEEQVEEGQDKADEEEKPEGAAQRGPADEEIEDEVSGGLERTSGAEAEDADDEQGSDEASAPEEAARPPTPPPPPPAKHSDSLNRYSPPPVDDPFSPIAFEGFSMQPDDRPTPMELQGRKSFAVSPALSAQQHFKLLTVNMCVLPAGLRNADLPDQLTISSLLLILALLVVEVVLLALSGAPLLLLLLILLVPLDIVLAMMFGPHMARLFGAVLYLLSGGAWSDHKRWRLQELVPRLADYDVVCLQEVYGVWPVCGATDYPRWLAKLAHEQGFPYVARPRSSPQFPSLSLNSGLLILSKHPIRETQALSFAHQSAYEKWLVNRGALATKVTLPGGGTAVVVTCHICPMPDMARCTPRALRRHVQTVRLEQVVELQAFVRAACRQDTQACLVAGDFNVGITHETHAQTTQNTEGARKTESEGVPKQSGKSSETPHASPAGMQEVAIEIVNEDEKSPPKEAKRRDPSRKDMPSSKMNRAGLYPHLSEFYHQVDSTMNALQLKDAFVVGRSGTETWEPTCGHTDGDPTHSRNSEALLTSRQFRKRGQLFTEDLIYSFVVPDRVQTNPLQSLGDVEERPRKLTDLSDHLGLEAWFSLGGPTSLIGSLRLDTAGQRWQAAL
eukprot:g57595.t1